MCDLPLAILKCDGLGSRPRQAPCAECRGGSSKPPQPPPSLATRKNQEKRPASHADPESTSPIASALQRSKAGNVTGIRRIVLLMPWSPQNFPKWLALAPQFRALRSSPPSPTIIPAPISSTKITIQKIKDVVFRRIHACHKDRPSHRAITKRRAATVRNPLSANARRQDYLQPSSTAVQFSSNKSCQIHRGRVPHRGTRHGRRAGAPRISGRCPHARHTQPHSAPGCRAGAGAIRWRWRSIRSDRSGCAAGSGSTGFHSSPPASQFLQVL